jgi:hypothetical protein
VCGSGKTNSSIDILKGQISEDNIEGLRGVAHLRKPGIVAADL